MNVINAGGSVASFEFGSQGAGDRVTVQVTSSKPGETAILITHVTESGSTPGHP
jgi:hypothetical protein